MNEKVSPKQKEKSSILTHRVYNETNDERREFARDRDRIIHARSFRRMMHKTQIFNANAGDHFRNRLTHTLEVMQIARSLGRLMSLDEDLIEAIALGHDLGHTPFGHVGERTLHNILMYGIDGNIPATEQGFKHNYQSVRIVESIEARCDEYQGINLTLATKEGIIKHTGLTVSSKNSERKELVRYSSKDLDTSLLRMDLEFSFTLEGQVVAVSDEIAQITHDIDDGIRGRIISFNDFISTPLFSMYNEDVSLRDASYNQRNKAIKGLVGFLINDVNMASSERVKKYHSENGIPSFENVSSVYESRCVWFSDKVGQTAEDLAIKRKKWILQSKIISQADSKAEYIIRQLFKAYYKHPKELPDYILARYYGKSDIKEFDRGIIRDDELQKDPYFIRLICDHIAGMSDQFAAREYNNLYVPEYC